MPWIQPYLQENFVISYTDGDQDMYTWQELTQSGAGGGIKTHRWWIMQDVSSSHALRSELLQLLQHINWPQV